MTDKALRAAIFDPVTRQEVYEKLRGLVENSKSLQSQINELRAFVTRTGPRSSAWVRLQNARAAEEKPDAK